MFTILRFIPQRKVLLFLGDLLIVIFSIPLSYKFLTNHFGNFSNLLLANSWIYFSLVGLWMVMLFLNRAYHVGKVTDWSYNLALFARTTIFSTLFLGFVFFLVPEVVFSKRVLVAHGLIIIVGLIVWRFLFSFLVTRTRFKSAVLIVGAGPAGELIAAELINAQNLGYQIVGFIDDETIKPVRIKLSKKSVIVPVIGSSSQLLEIVRKHKVSLIVDAIRGTKGVELLQALSSLEMGQVRIVPMHHLYEFLSAKVPVKHVEGSWLVFDEFQPKGGLGEVITRIFNFAIATTGLIISLPILIIVSVLIKLESRGPIIYQQTRVGLGGKEFTIYKFRSMRRDAENGRAIWATANDSRVTRVGKIIRMLRLDEIPQLINIWKGEMNLVGPRPERPEFVRKLEKVIPFYQKRHLVKPGVTGWAQVKYTYASTTQDSLEKLQYELYYIKRRNFLLDLVIIIKTIDVVLTGRGAK